FDVAMRHPLFGVGIGNYPEYSIKGKAAHNSYLEIAAELGWIGLGAYLVFILAPILRLRRIETELLRSEVNSRRHSDSDRELYFLSIGLQAVIVAYLVCSFFSSSQYFWHLYYVVAYAVALRHIYATRPDGAVKEGARESRDLSVKTSSANVRSDMSASARSEKMRAGAIWAGR